jgi:nucleoside-diphosphate-sugar epimerase
MNGARALVTGATGFIGRHVVDRLLELGTQVAVVIRPGGRLSDPWRGRVAAIECVDWSETGLRAALAPHPFDTVFHVAAYGVAPTDRDVDQILRINVALAPALVRLCRERGARMVATGTFSEYGPPRDETPLTEDAPLQSSKIYGASKAAGGLVASALAAQLGVGLRLLRLFKVYGAGEAPHRLLPSLVASLPQGRRVPLSAGTQVLDFVYVKDVVEACLRADAHMAAQSQPSAATWNVCTGTGHSVRTFALKVAQALGAPANLLGFGDIPMRPDDEPWLVGSGERMHAAVGWRPAFDLDAGVRDAVASLSAGVPSSDLAVRSPTA